MSSIDRTGTPAGEEYATVCAAFELSKAKWLIGIVVPGKARMSRHTVDGGDGFDEPRDVLAHHLDGEFAGVGDQRFGGGVRFWRQHLGQIDCSRLARW